MNRSLMLLSVLFVGCATGAQSESEDQNLDWLDSSDVQYDLPIPADAEFAEDRILVGFWDMDKPDALGLGGHDLPRVRDFVELPVAVFQLEAGDDVRETVEELRASGRYRFVEPDYVRTSSSVNDPYYSYQWHFDEVNAAAAWSSSIGSGTVVAVIDTGVTSGPYDGINNIVSGYNFVSSSSNAADDNGHGTHVAGTIAQASNNSAGVAGLAYGADIMPIKSLDSSGSGYTSDVVAGINWAVSNGADVINMSLGSSSYSSSEATAVLNAWQAGVFVAAATGNSYSNTVEYPAAYTGAVAVGATAYAGSLPAYSNTGSAIDLVAPGGNTSVDANGDGYADGVLQETFSGSSWSYYFFQGTSMATPHVAAAAAMLMANGATNEEALDALEATAFDLGSTGWDSSHGWGLIQVDDALAYYAGSSSGTDADGDGYDDTVDCDDTDSAVNPGAAEVCGDGIDNDCDGVDDVCTVDLDGDGYDDTVDCDDTDASVNPGATEVCGDGIDNDCDGVDDTCPVDADGDGYDDTVDCDDTDASVNPGATEVCGDGIDNDCDGVDDTCSSAPTISGVSSSTSKKTLTVSWTTDEPTTGRLCNARGRCANTSLGTSHAATVRKQGGSFTITATDVDGETDSYSAAY
jgi:serine protease